MSYRKDQQNVEVGMLRYPTWEKVMELFVPGYHSLRFVSSSKAENSVYCIYVLIFRDRTHSENAHVENMKICKKAKV